MAITKTIQQQLSTQLQQDLGYSLTDWQPFAGTLPGSLQYLATAYQAQLVKQPVIIVMFRDEAAVTADQVLLWQQRLKTTLSRQFILIFQAPTRNLLMRLMRQQVPFLTLAGDYYLPFLALRLLATPKIQLPKIAPVGGLSAKASRLLTVLLYGSAGISAGPQPVFDAAGYLFRGGQKLLNTYAALAGIDSQSTLSRCLQELEMAGTIIGVGSRRQRGYTFAATGSDLFYQVRGQMASPVLASITLDEAAFNALLQQQGYAPQQLIGLPEVALGGLTAITTVTTIIPDLNCQTWAFSKGFFKQIFGGLTATHRKQLAQKYQGGRQITVQQWDMNPNMIRDWLQQHHRWSTAHVPDPVSLYLANDEPENDRITGALEDLIENLMGAQVNV
jgi:hypothetical protein